VGNLDDDLERLRECDWILEAVVEKLDIKRALFEKIAPYLKPGAIVSTNTSGLSITDMAASLPEALRPHFLGTHFFNPPRYLHLLELVPHAGTDPALLAFMRDFGDATLGKGVVIAKDSPDFIANRIGTFSVMSAIRALIEGGYTVEEVDALTGPLIGRPRSATFRTLDLVGLDIMVHASTTVVTSVRRATRSASTSKRPSCLRRCSQAVCWATRAERGFYQKVRGASGASEIQTLDIATLSYRERQSAKFPALEAAEDRRRHRRSGARRDQRQGSRGRIRLEDARGDVPVRGIPNR
jgi:3-hydroxyacyl-CoA dehydrogenase